jgi:hypothetical protein
MKPKTPPLQGAIPARLPQARLTVGELCGRDIGATVYLYWMNGVEVVIDFLELVVEDGRCVRVVVGFPEGHLDLAVDTPVTITSPAPVDAVPVEEDEEEPVVNYGTLIGSLPPSIVGVSGTGIVSTGIAGPSGLSSFTSFDPGPAVVEITGDTEHLTQTLAQFTGEDLSQRVKRMRGLA